MLYKTIVDNMWKEIIKVRAERQTLVIRLPVVWCRENKVKKGSYLVCKHGHDDSLIVTTFESEVNNAERTKVRRD